MARYEIVAHVTRELDCDTPEEAAAIFRRQLRAATGHTDGVMHLAVWRHDPEPSRSPLPPALRQALLEFFDAVERCAGEAEDAFRGRVEAILMASTMAAEDKEPGGA